jgi:biofilm protein TabA
MIYDRLANAEQYAILHPRFSRAIAELQSRDWSQAELGTHTIDGEDIFINLMDYETKRLDETVWEAHRDYIDIQFIVSGEEKMGHAFIDTLNITQPYDKSVDAELYLGDGQQVTYAAGTIAIFFPHDGHRPSLSVDEANPSNVRKAVAKVRIAE